MQRKRKVHCNYTFTSCASANPRQGRVPRMAGTMAKKFPVHPARPERTCWGCDRYCAADALACGNGSGRTQHPIETQGEDWYVAWGIEPNPDRPSHAKR